MVVHMYYLIMKTAVKLDLKSNAYFSIKSYTRLREKEICLIDFKFYQKIFIVLISLSTILIFPETPRDLENICENYNSRKSCLVW